ncbi:acetate--CoA ligase family protein [bacterium]|nr:acetate--CoA ligase family protein [bacterium]
MNIATRQMMEEPAAIQLIQKYGLKYPDHCWVTSAEEAAEFAAASNDPIVLKIISPQVIHKSDAGGVITGIVGAETAARQFREMIEKVKRTTPGAEIKGALACRQAEPGLELIIGGLRDSVFGPTVMFGLGGIFTEVFKDVTFRIAPLDRIDAEEMLDEIKGRILLDGYRGQPAVDRNALAEALLAVGNIMLAEDDVEELDLNPVRVYPAGLLVLDARVIKKY